MKIVIGGILLLLGAIVLTVGHFVAQGGITAIKTSLRESVEMNSAADFEENFSSSNSTRTMTVFSVTNALAVQEEGATPIFETKEVTVDYEEVNYDPLVSDDGESYTFKKWWTYHIPKDAEAVLAEEVITVNPVYLGALAGAAGDESNLMLGSANAVVAQMAGVFLETLPQFMQLSSLTGYLGGLSAALQANGMTEEQIIGQWHAGFDAPLSVMLNNPAFTGFEVQLSPEGVDAAGAEYLWDPSSTYSFMSPTGVAGWAEAVQCLAAAGEDDTAICMVEGLPAFDIIEDVGRLNFIGALTWIQTLTTTNDPYYFGVIKAGLVGAGLAGVADAESWTDLGALQFGTGQMVYGMTGGAATSLVALGIDALPFTSSPELTCYAAEYNTAVGGLAAYGADATLAPFPAGAGLSIDQVKAFFTVFSQQDKTISFLLAAGAAAAGDTSLITTILYDATYASTGLAPSNWIIYANYLSVRLSKDILIGDIIVGFPLDEGGVGSVNSGLFVRRTVGEVLFGWDDPLFAVMGLDDEEYNGMFGKLYASPEAQEAAVLDASRTYSRKTGVGSPNAANAQQEIMVQGVTAITRRDDIAGGTCEDAYTLMILQDPETCPVWTETETISGLSSDVQSAMTSEDWTWDNYMEVGAEVDERHMWLAVLLRAMPLSNAGEGTVGGGIRVHEFSTHPSTFLGDCSDGVTPCNEANAKYRMDMGDGLIPMEYGSAGAPMVVSQPYFVHPDGELAGVLECLDLSAMPQDYNHKTMGSWLKVEPLTGTTMDAAVRLQVNFNVNSAMLNGGVHPNLFTEEGCESIIWPFVIVEVLGGLTDSQAKDFRALVYGNIDMFKMIWYIMGIGGALLAICGIALIVVGVTQKDEKKIGFSTESSGV